MAERPRWHVCACWLWTTFARTPVWWVCGIVRDPGTGDASGSRLTALLLGCAGAYALVYAVRAVPPLLTGAELVGGIAAVVASGSVALWSRGRGGRGTPSDGGEP